MLGAAVAMALPQLTAHEALSGVFGSISLASWIFLLVSQSTALLKTLEAISHPAIAAR